MSEPPPGVVDVWTLAAPAPSVAHLSSEEIRRADAMGAAPARRRFVAGRAALREILARHLGGTPASVALEYAPCPACGGPHGKPRVVGDPLHFSVSHSHERLLVAVSAAGPVGVDLERVDPARRLDVVAEVAFTEDERRELDRLPALRRRESALRLWTRKEACVKALGVGVEGMDSFRVSVPPRPPRLVQPGPAGRRAVALLDLDPARGYVGALAALDDVERVRVRSPAPNPPAGARLPAGTQSTIGRRPCPDRRATGTGDGSDRGTPRAGTDGDDPGR